MCRVIASKLGDINAFGADLRRVAKAGHDVDGAEPIDFGTKYKNQNDAFTARFDSLGSKFNGKTLDDYVNGKSFCCNEKNLDEIEQNETNSAENAKLEDNLYFYHPDHLGSTSIVTNYDGEVSQNVAYIPYGEVFVEERNGSWATPFLFNAKELDEETGLYYYGARYLDPMDCRWLSPDPKWDDYKGVSPYAYCLNNPVKLIDPDGRDAQVTINEETNTITIKAEIILEGKYATKEIAKKYQDDIDKNWGSIKQYEYEGKTYDLVWDVSVRVKQKGESRDYNGVNNYVTPFDKKNSMGRSNSFVINNNTGEWRMYNLDSSNPAAHEFGHMLGLYDYYETNKKSNTYGLPLNSTYNGNIMAMPSGMGKVDNVIMEDLMLPIINRHNRQRAEFEYNQWRFSGYQNRSYIQPFNTSHYVNKRFRSPKPKL